VALFFYLEIRSEISRIAFVAFFTCSTKALFNVVHCHIFFSSVVCPKVSGAMHADS